MIQSDSTQPDVKYTLIGTAGGDPDTGDIYRGLDRFGRIKDSDWYNYGTSADADRIKYGYDRSGSRIWRENVVARSQGKYFDEKYLYDQILPGRNSLHNYPEKCALLITLQSL